MCLKYIEFLAAVDKNAKKSKKLQAPGYAVWRVFCVTNDIRVNAIRVRVGSHRALVMKRMQMDFTKELPKIAPPEKPSTYWATFTKPVFGIGPLECPRHGAHEIQSLHLDLAKATTVLPLGMGGSAEASA